MTSARRSDQRDLSVETARGVACLLVVMFHVIGSTTEGGLRLPAVSPWFVFGQALDFVHMPVFAFLAGIAYAYSPLSRGGTLRFARKKALRIALPLFVVTTLYLAAQQVVPTNSPRPSHLWAAYAYPYMHMWYLMALLWVLAAAGLFDRLGLMRGWALPVLFVASCVVFAHRGAWLTPVFGGIGAGYLFPFFLVGIAWRRWSLRERVSAPGLATLAAVGAVSLAALVHWITAAPAWPPAVVAPLRLAAGIGLAVAFVGAGPVWRWAVWLGGVSYPVYLFHIFGTAAARNALHGLGIWEVPIHLVVGTVAGIAAGVLVKTLAGPISARTGLPLSLVLYGERAARAGGRTPLPLAREARTGQGPA